MTMPSEATDAVLIEALDKETKRYIQLANLKSPKAYILDDQASEMWHIIRGLAVLDWALVQPANSLGDLEALRQQAEEKWRTLMRKVHKLATEIQEEHNRVNNSN